MRVSQAAPTACTALPSSRAGRFRLRAVPIRPSPPWITPRLARVRPTERASSWAEAFERLTP